MTDTASRLSAALADRYTIEHELGAGGMATVYLAHDIKHDRKVAVKVLRPELAAVIGAERFLAEIKTTANLQHPHILPLFDSGVADSFLYYVMPYIEGIALRDRLTKEKQLPINDAVRLATEVASALDYAHRHGVIHRDIKPENILLHDGSALVADFGIALAASKAGTRMTETGMSLGTPQYMSPEQAMGERELDARSDVYALGCVTYEMLTGEPPFSGPTAQAIVAKVMTAEPADATSLRKTIPASVAEAVHTALQKLPADRFATAAEFSAALQSDTTTSRRTGAVPRTADNPRRAKLAAIITFVAAIAAVLGNRLGGSHAPTAIALGKAMHLTWDAGLEVTPALSPDGRSVTYSAGPVANPHILVRVVGEGRAIRLTGDTTTMESNPAWSSDGATIYFLAHGGIFSAPAGGGQGRPEIPGDEATPITSVAPAPDGKRLGFARGDSLIVRNADASLHGLAKVTEPTLCTWSPTGAFIACASGNQLYAQPGAGFGNLSPSRVVLCRVSDGQITTITDSMSLNTSPTWSPDGKSVYFVSDRDGRRDIYMVGIGSNGLTSGEPVRLSVGLGAHTISLSGTGARLAYSLFTARMTSWWTPIPVHPGTTLTSANRITNANEAIEQVSGSVDGKWLYYDSDLTGNDDIFRIPIGGGEAQRLTTDPADDFAPSVSPDGKSFAFHSWRSGSRDIFVQRIADGVVEQVTHSPRQEALANWAPDGNALAYSELSGNGAVWIVKRKPAGGWEEPVRRVDHGSNPVWSPNGRLIAYVESLIGGGVEVVPADSGPARRLLDTSVPGTPFADVMAWKDNETLLFSSHDPRGRSFVYSIPAQGGNPTKLLEFDPSIFPMYRGTVTVTAGRLYFESEDKQSDVWVIDVKKRP